MPRWTWPWEMPVKTDVTITFRVDPPLLALFEKLLARLGGMTPAEAAAVAEQVNAKAAQIQTFAPESK